MTNILAIKLKQLNDDIKTINETLQSVTEMNIDPLLREELSERWGCELHFTLILCTRVKNAMEFFSKNPKIHELCINTSLSSQLMVAECEDISELIRGMSDPDYIQVALSRIELKSEEFSRTHGDSR